MSIYDDINVPDLSLESATTKRTKQTGDPENIESKFHVRWMIRRDMPEVLQIERSSNEYPWEEEDFLRTLRQRNCIGMVVEGKTELNSNGTSIQDREPPVVGFMIYELGNDYLDLVNLAVHPDYKRQGVGTAMISKLISKLSSHRRTSISLIVRDSNLFAHLFYKKLGFVAIGVLRDYYQNLDNDFNEVSTEDAYQMVYELRTDVVE